MLVTGVKIFLVHPGGAGAANGPDFGAGAKNLCFVKVETDEGLHGWGECYTQSDRDTQIVAHVEQLARYLIGRDPALVKNFTQIVYDDIAARRGSMDLFSALSGLEQAMWDITGKALGMPVHALMGGPVRSRLRVYANGWYGGAKEPSELAERAAATVEMGFAALKFDPIPGPWRSYIDRDIERRAIANVAAVRAAVGPDIDVLIEVHRRLAPMHAVRLAREIEPYEPFWFEEPVLAENMEALAQARSKIRIPVVTGEELYSKFEFRRVFETGAADIINPDVCNVGGILELREIAATAETYFVGVAPHNYNSTSVGLAATAHASAAMPNFVITEYFVNLDAVSQEIADRPFSVKDGHIAVPTGPGLGIDLDEKAMAAHAYRQFPTRQFGDLHDG
jgi:galactonate dehydratase